MKDLKGLTGSTKPLYPEVRGITGLSTGLKGLKGITGISLKKKMKKLTQAQLDKRSDKAWANLDKRIILADKKHQKEIDKAYQLYDKEK